jgi:hypothetical protein
MSKIEKPFAQLTVVVKQKPEVSDEAKETE